MDEVGDQVDVSIKFKDGQRQPDWQRDQYGIV